MHEQYITRHKNVTHNEIIISSPPGELPDEHHVIIGCGDKMTRVVSEADASDRQVVLA